MQAILCRFHALIAWPLFSFCTTLAGVGIVLARLLGPIDPGHRVGAAALRWSWGGLLWVVQPFWQRSFIGLENLTDGPVILVANHESSIDILALFGLPTPVKMVAKEANFSHWLMAPFLTLSGQVSTSGFMEDAEAALDAGMSVLVFAEGGRRPGARLRRFKKGAFLLAERSGYPVVPVAVVGCAAIAPIGRWLPTQLVTPVLIEIGEAHRGDEAEALREEVHTAMGGMLDRLRPAVAGL